MPITTTDTTLTGIFTDDQGNTLNGTLTFVLSGFGADVPKIAGVQLLPGLSFTAPVVNGVFSTSFYSNLIITPNVTFYSVSFQQSGALVNQIYNFSKNYQFGPGIFDISQLTPLGSTISNTSLPNSVTPFTFVPQPGKFLNGLDATGKFSSAFITSTPRLFNRCFVDGITYANLAAAYNDTTNCFDIQLPPNYTETQTGGQFHFNRSNVNITCMGGNCVITNVAGWQVDAGVKHVGFLSETPWGASTSGPTSGLKFSGYTGSGVAFAVGDATADVMYFGMKNVYVDLVSASAGATAIKFFRTEFFDLFQFTTLITADSQTGIATDGTPCGSAFTGFGTIRNVQIGSGVGATNATGISSGFCTSAFEVSGGNIVLLPGGNTICFKADGGEFFLDFPNCNTANTAVVTLVNGASAGRVDGTLRTDSGVTTLANFGAGTAGSHIYAAGPTVSIPIIDSSTNAFNTVITNDSFWLNPNHWSIAGAGTAPAIFVVKDVVNNRSVININPLGFSLLGTGVPGRAGAGGQQFAVGVDGGLTAGNTQDVAWNFIIDSGLTAGQQESIIFRDRGVTKWTIFKNASNNNLQIMDSANLNRILFDPGETDINAAAGASAINFNVATNSGTGGVQFWSGGAGSTQKSKIDSNGNFHPATAAGVGLGLGTLPFLNVIIGSGNSAVSTITSVSTTNKSVVFPDIAGNVLLDAGTQTVTGLKNFTTIGTATNCSSSSGTCAAASAGSVSIAAAATTVTVATTAVTANSQVIVTRDDSLGTKLGVTCNTQSSLVLGAPRVTARTGATSFVITIDVGPTTNPMCLSYQVIN